ncbi:MAG: hypothetical protein ABI435_01410 [Pseudolysinimonas sp.]
MKQALAIPAAVGLIVLAFAAASTTPQDAQIEAPFVTFGTVGHQIFSEHLTAEVHSVTLAHVVELDDWVGTTSGIWLVVDASVGATTDSAYLQAGVTVGDTRYPASSRPDHSINGRAVDTGFSITGSFLFELPSDILDRPGATSAAFQIRSGLDPRLDSVIELRLDLTTLELRDRVTVDPSRDDQ